MTDTVRQATIHDLDQLVSLFDGYRRIGEQPSDPTIVRQFLSNRLVLGASVLVIAEDPNDVEVEFVRLCC